MILKVMGAVCIITGCSGVGFSASQNVRREQNALLELVSALEWMICELSYRMSPLPELCRGAAAHTKGAVSKVFEQLSAELEQQLTPDAAICMRNAIESVRNIPPQTALQLQTLGQGMGQFDIQGQLSVLEGAAERCRQANNAITEKQAPQLRNYQTLGICTGIGLVILLL